MHPTSTHRRKRVLHRQYNIATSKSNHRDDLFSTHDCPQTENHNNSVRKKSDRLLCTVCDGPAFGYNFDAISCESCKAFFRRNALRSGGKFQCRSADGQCLITVTTRKRCKACRLTKCLKKGMRVDWILSEEERIQKRLKIEENRRLRQIVSSNSIESDESSPAELRRKPVKIEDPKLSHFLFSILLPYEDLDKIQQIQNIYKDSVRLVTLPSSILSYPHTARIQAPWDMLNFPANIQALRLITYFKLMPEFVSLDEDDKFILIKYNTFALVFMRSALSYNQLTDSYHEQDTDDCVFSGGDFIQCFSLFQYVQLTRAIVRLLDASKNDRLIIQILLIIILFSKGSSLLTQIDEVEPIVKDILSIYRAQNIFIDLLWKYCEEKFGFAITVEIWLKLVTSSIDIHLQAYNIRQNYIKNEFVAHQLVPLMKSVTLIV
ncbi:unnamed protein product [Rotaria magnacalcarata]|uniref:Nuclear receptor domain-containing protein n=3 Tax=Rotaria magnacalcarata TaxID=392030 RepID=A0A815SUD0_9BILA|nr:unnamed protein product [Rotaria magnacalcarata]CAF2173648.1 unnamed protein product [Rotaria magnacalcarata]